MNGMATKQTQHFIDDNGDRWTFEHVLRDGGIDLHVTAPGAAQARILRPTKQQPPLNPRPSLDGEEPLPLENL